MKLCTIGMEWQSCLELNPSYKEKCDLEQSELNRNCFSAMTEV